MKKAISLLLAAITAAILPGCNNEQPTDIPETTTTVSNTETTAAETEKPEIPLDISGFTVIGRITENVDDKRITYEKEISEAESIEKLGEILDTLKDAEPVDADYLNEFYSVTFRNDETDEAIGMEYVTLFIENDGVCTTERGFLFDKNGHIAMYSTGYGWQTSVFPKLLSDELISEENTIETKEAPCFDENYSANGEKFEKGRIVFINEYYNYAWGYQHSGSFTDDLGNIYYFDLACLENKDDGRTLLDILYDEVYYKSRPAAHTDPEKIIKCTEKIPQINTSAEMKGEAAACDAGIYTLYIVDENNKLIALSESGDWEGTLVDSAAKSIVKICNSMTMERYSINR